MTDFFTRPVWPVRSIDGDTSDWLEDNGRREYAVRRDRDLGINTPEMHATDPEVRAKAVEAKQFREAWLIEHVAHNTATLKWPKLRENDFGQTAMLLWAEYVAVPYFVLHSEKPDSFDRWLSTIECQAGHSLQQALLDAGLAVPFAG